MHRWRGVRFLCYHSVCPPDELREIEQLTPAMSVDGFRRHLQLMREAGYRVISMERALELVVSGDAERGQYVCLTFDDGRLDNFVHVWPMVRDAGYSAHFFVSSALVGETVHHQVGATAIVERYMDAEMIRQIVREGGSIGSHADHHVDLTTLDEDTLRRELGESRRLLEELTRGPIQTHAYPWAVYDRTVLAATRAAGYGFAFGATAGGTVKQLGPSDRARLTIPRNTMRGGPDAEENYVVMRGGLDFTRTYSDLKMRWTHR